VFNSLVSLDSKAQPVPELVESWVPSDDRLTLTLKLRRDVTFHSARPFTAEDAKWNLEHVQDPKTGAQSGPALSGVRTQVVDASTLELRLPDVLPQIFSLLADVLIIDPQSEIATNAAGTGPFKVDNFTPANEMQLVRNTHYWRPDRPFLDSVTVRSIADLNSGLVALESGAIHLAQCPESAVQRLKAGDRTSATVLPGVGNYCFNLNVTNPNLSDRRVRQAIDLALDRKRFANTLLYGLTDPTYIMWPRNSPVWDAALDVGEFNLDKARRLLSDAGYSSGFDMKIQTSTGYPALNPFAQVIQADLASIGINTSVEVLEAAAASALLSQAAFPAMLTNSYAYANQDPAMIFTAFPFRPTGNAAHFESEEYRGLADVARREPNWEKRLGLYRRIALLVKNEAFALPVANAVTPWAHLSHVKGVAGDPFSSAPFLEGINVG
jgi:peptide/nickel transport system substrate-binding protein